MVSEYSSSQQDDLEKGREMPEFQANKFKELILYIAQRCFDDPTFGAVKLNKTLYFADFYAYGDTSVSITGATYFRLHHGPAPRQLVPMREELKESGDICVTEVQYHGYPQERIVTTREANLDLFTAQEISLVDDIIQKLWGINAADISEYTHRLAGWRIAEENSDIPYESVFLSDEGLTDDDSARAKELVHQFDWLD